MEPGLLKSADWPVLIEVYFFLGGIAGGAFVIATIANLLGHERYRDIVKKSGADIVLSNHTAYDNTPANIKKLATRTTTDRNPYVVGNAAVLRYITTAEECAKAGYLATTKLAGTSSR